MSLLTCENISRSFFGVKALDDVSVTVEEGETLGIIGPNGSGKTTLFNIVSGIDREHEGRVTLAGTDITTARPHRIVGHGMVRTFQNLRLFKGMSALENVVSGGHCRSHKGLLGQILGTASVRRSEADLRERARDCLAEVGLAGYEASYPTELSYGQTKRLELARALNAEPRILLLDEPTAGMNDVQAGEILGLLARIRERHDLTLIVIEHNVPVLSRFAGRIVVLDAGRKLTEGRPDEVTADPRVIEAYLGAGAE